MINKILVALFIFLILFVSFVFAEDLDQWEFTREIKDISSGYNEISLDELIYKNSKRNLEDLRIIDSEGKFVPYYLDGYKNKKESVLSTYNSTQILQFQKKANNYVDFKLINESNNEDIIVNELLLNLKINKDFLYDVNIYGSYDNLSWDYISSDKVYRTNDGIKNSLKFGESLKYEYYRIVFLNEYEDLSVENLKAVNVKENLTNISYKETKEIPYDLETKDNISSITITNEDLLKIKQIKINSNDTFDRYYTIGMKDNETDDFRYFNSGRIYNIDLENFSTAHKRIELNSYTKNRFLIIKISNEDNAPIDIESIDITYFIDSIVFEAKENESYTLVLGNENVKKPNYDIESFKGYIDSEDKNLAKLGALSKNKLFEPTKKTSYDFKLILNTLVIVLTGVLIVVIFKNYKKTI
jgi:hypothetical protein